MSFDRINQHGFPLFSRSSGIEAHYSFVARKRRNLASTIRVDMRSVHPFIVQLLRSFSLVSMTLRQRLIALLDLIKMRRNSNSDCVVTTPRNAREQGKQQDVIKWLACSPVDDLSG
jgi:hypothetical protein